VVTLNISLSCQEKSKGSSCCSHSNKARSNSQLCCEAASSAATGSPAASHCQPQPLCMHLSCRHVKERQRKGQFIAEVFKFSPHYPEFTG